MEKEGVDHKRVLIYWLPTWR